MAVFFYLLFFLTLIIAGIYAFLINKGIVKRKNMKFLFILVGIIVISFGLGNLLDSDSSTTNTKASSNSNKNEIAEESDKVPVSDIPITKDQYNKIKIGMTNKEVEQILGKVSEDNRSKLENNEYEWVYSDENLGLAYITFNNKSNIVEEKSELGILSEDSNTITDKNGTRKDKSLVSADDESADNSDRSDEIESTIESIIDEDFTFDTSLKKFELNENVGTDKKDDYVAKIFLSYDQVHSAKTTKKWIGTYTNDLAAKLAKKEHDITSLSIFWETPRFKKDWNTAKFNLTKRGNTFYFDSENYDGTVFN